MDVSIIMPVYNGEKWLDETLDSVRQQTFSGSIQLSVYNDSSTDGSNEILRKWGEVLKSRGIDFIINESEPDTGPKGVGYAKNKSVAQSNGRFLCFLDADDVMHPHRIEKQFLAAHNKTDTLIGSKLHRLPEGSTERFINWANNMNEKQLYTQIYTSHGPTILMPTWFCSRSVFDKVGGFDESGKGTPEDLIFFYRHLNLGGKILRVDEDLLMYRYHPEATTFSIKEETIWNIRINEISNNILIKWESFTIWNAGKQGRKFYRSLTDELRKKVIAFCDVDAKKIAKGFYIYEDSKELPRPKIPVVHFSQAKKPFVICMKQDLMKGGFEENLASLNLNEGEDFFFFS